MNDATTAETLQELVRRESRSLFQYVREVPVWVATADLPVLARLRALAEAERAATDLLGKHLQKRGQAPSTLGAFPPEFTGLNDAALNYLLPKLVREQKRATADVEADLTTLDDDPAVPMVQRILHLKREHLQALESLSARPHTIR